MTIPSRMVPTAFYLFTLDGHIELYSTTEHTRDADGNYVYTIPGSGSEWAAKAVELSPRHYPSLLAFCKLTQRQIDWGGYNNVGYRVIDPTQSYDESARLEPGTDH